MNAETQFSDFVKRQQRPAAIDTRVDWTKERDDWLTYLARLYDEITTYLEDYTDSGAIQIRESTIEINEENIGVYTAKRLAIVIGAQEITLTPVGTSLIGSKGRVDVEGSGGHSRLVLVDRNVADARSMVRVTIGLASDDEPSRPPKPIEWAWKIVSSPPSLKFIDLNKDSLFAMLMEVSNG